MNGNLVIPVYVAESEMDLAGTHTFKPFSYRELDSINFPDVKHARGRDVQHTLDLMR